MGLRDCEQFVCGGNSKPFCMGGPGRPLMGPSQKTDNGDYVIGHDHLAAHHIAIPSCSWWTTIPYVLLSTSRISGTKYCNVSVQFLKQLAALFESTKNSGSVWLTHKRRMLIAHLINHGRKTLISTSNSYT